MAQIDTIRESSPTKIYLASPYSHESNNIKEKRFIIISYLAAHFTNSDRNLCVYSPILVGHTMCKYINFPQDYNFWATRDKQFIKWADEFWQVRLDGWEKSIGMADEEIYAREIGKKLKSVEISTGMSEREFSMECLFRKTCSGFSDKVKLNIEIKEIN